MLAVVAARDAESTLTISLFACVRSSIATLWSWCACSAIAMAKFWRGEPVNRLDGFFGCFSVVFMCWFLSGERASHGSEVLMHLRGHFRG